MEPRSLQLYSVTQTKNSPEGSKNIWSVWKLIYKIVRGGLWKGSIPCFTTKREKYQCTGNKGENQSKSKWRKQVRDGMISTQNDWEVRLWVWQMPSCACYEHPVMFWHGCKDLYVGRIQFCKERSKQMNYMLRVFAFGAVFKRLSQPCFSTTINTNTLCSTTPNTPTHLCTCTPMSGHTHTAGILVLLPFSNITHSKIHNWHYLVWISFNSESLYLVVWTEM